MLKIKQKKLSDLTHYENNTKLHPPEQVEQIANSIKEYGFVNPILIDKDGIIVAGHGRALAAEKLGIDEVPTIILHDLTEVQRKAFTIADNKLTMSSGFDMDILQSEISEIMELDDSLIETLGFTDEELEAINDGVEDEVVIDGEIDDDEAPEPEDHPVIKFGDLIEFPNGSRLICGDSTEAETIKKLMNGEKARMVNTDPPFGVNYQTTRFGEIVNDDLTGDAFSNFLIQCFKQLHKYTIENPALYIYYAIWNHRVFEDALEKTGFRVKQQLIWAKNMFAFGRSDYHWKHEPCFYAVKEDLNSEWFGDRTQTTLIETEDLEDLSKEDLIEIIDEIKKQSTVWEVSKDPTTTYVHPTQKPVRLAEMAILNSSKKGEIILEPFSGSGSTLIAGFKTGRRVYAIEFDTSYVQVDIQRMVEFSGDPTVTINGETVDWYEYKKQHQG